MHELMDKRIECPCLTKRVIDFVLVKVRDYPLENFMKSLDAVVNAALENGALVEQIMSSLVLVTYGAADICPSSEEKRKRLVSELIEKHGKDIAIVEGRQETLAGTYGSLPRMTFGSIIQDMWGLLKKLEALNYGESKEIGKAAA